MSRVFRQGRSESEKHPENFETSENINKAERKAARLLSSNIQKCRLRSSKRNRKNVKYRLTGRGKTKGSDNSRKGITKYLFERTAGDRRTGKVNTGKYTGSVLSILSRNAEMLQGCASIPVTGDVIILK